MSKEYMTLDINKKIRVNVVYNEIEERRKRGNAERGFLEFHALVQVMTENEWAGFMFTQTVPAWNKRIHFSHEIADQVLRKLK